MSSLLGGEVKVEAPATPKRPFPRKTESPCARRALATPPKAPVIHVAHDVDIAELMEGAEDWDWDDMNSDILTPKRSPKKTVRLTRLLTTPRAMLMESGSLLLLVWLLKRLLMSLRHVRAASSKAWKRIFRRVTCKRYIRSLQLCRNHDRLVWCVRYLLCR